MFHAQARARMLAVTLSAMLALGGITAATGSAAADDTGDVGITVTVADKLPAGPVGCHITLPVGSIAHLLQVLIRLFGLKPFSHVEVWVHSTPYLLASGTADADGNFDASGYLPDDLELGGHTLVVEGTSAAGDPFSQVAASFAITEAGTIGSATTSDSNGVLGLVVPNAAVAVFAAPTLVQNRSTTLGVLGDVVVADGRIITQEGWTLSAGVTDFVNAADGSVIGKAQLGIAPQLVSTEAAGISTAAAQAAGTATFPMGFAAAAPGQTVGNTVLNAALTFVAPQEKAAGTYASTLTLTVVSQ